MKLTRFIALGIAAVGFTAATQAATFSSYLTGSTAFRAATENAIQHYANGVADGGAGGVQFGFTGATLGGANQSIFKWTQGGGADTYFVFTDWTGSEGGIQTVADASKTIPFLPATSTVSVSPGTSGLSPGTDLHHPDAAMSDTFQGTSAFNGGIYAALTEAVAGGVGIVPFKWCANNGSLVTSVTFDSLQRLYSTGKVPLSFFTGVGGADHLKPVMALGRDPDSGTRLTAFACDGYGALTPVTQYQPQDSTNALVNTIGQTITRFVKWPQITVNGIVYPSPNGGYNSGGDLSKALSAPRAATVTIVPAGPGSPYNGANISMVAYLGTSDADTNLLGAGVPVGNRGIELSFNGVTLGNVGGDYNTSTVLTEGKFTFWGYEHMYYNAGTIDPTVQGVCNGIANQIFNTDATTKIASMAVKRSTDGTPIQVSTYANP